MILPIVAYGHPILRKVATDISADYPGLQEFVASMWETMYASNGVGIAAPQVNKSIRVFVVDTKQMLDNMDEEERLDYADDAGVKKAFINAHVTAVDGEPWAYNEGCLSIPRIREDVKRPEYVTINYVDENFEPHTDTFNGLSARVILHEYDHIEGKLFIDLLPPLKKQLIKGKLKDISNGKIKQDYKMIFA
ncbi:MAG: peptide deformylase [Niabella sp.]